MPPLTEESRLPVFLSAIRAAMSRVPVWIFCWIVVLLAASAVSLPWIGWFDGALAHRFEPGSVRASLDEAFRFDHREGLGALRTEGQRLAAALAVFMIFFGAFSAGGWLQVFLERTSGRSVRRFLWGGARYFWRFLRLAVLSILVLAFVTWVFYGWPWKTLVLELLFGATDGNLEVLDSERTALWLEWMQHGLYALSFALVLSWGDYTRTRLALHNTSSAVWAGICTFAVMLANPVRTLRPFLLILLVEMAVLRGVGAVSWPINAGIDAESGRVALLALFLLGQLALVWQAVSRGARYSAAVQISRILVPPPPHPDVWGKRIGGPGGPQYPIDDSDEYNVSI